MSLGYNRQTKIVALGDSARLSAYLFDDRDQKYSSDDLASVTFAIQKPPTDNATIDSVVGLSVTTTAGSTAANLNGVTGLLPNKTYSISSSNILATTTITFTTGATLPSSPYAIILSSSIGVTTSSGPVIAKITLLKILEEGEIEDDGSGYLVFNDTDRIGHHTGVATFTLSDGTIKSTRTDFEVFDPFEVVDTQTRIIADGVWTKLEDCFDAENEGPWIQDMTLNFFHEEKMEKFIAEALFDINYQNPPTDVGIDSFVTSTNFINTNYPLLVQGVFVQVLRHVMRSYVEQPLPTGAQIAYQDRRDYLTRWQGMYELELAQYMRWLALWKRGFLQLGHSRLLVSAKAGRLIPAPMRARSAGRGYW